MIMYRHRYVTLFPCCECTKLVIQSGIRHIIFLDDKGRDDPVCGLHLSECIPWRPSCFLSGAPPHPGLRVETYHLFPPLCVACSTHPTPRQVFVASRRMLDLAGVKYTRHEPSVDRIRLDFGPVAPPTPAVAWGALRSALPLLAAAGLLAVMWTRTVSRC